MLSIELIEKRNRLRRFRGRVEIAKSLLRLFVLVTLTILSIASSYSIADSQFNVIQNFNLINLTLNVLPIASTTLFIMAIVKDINK